MKKLFVVAFLFTIVSVSANAVSSKNKKEVAGEWKYEVPTAPYGYEKGTLVFNEKEGELSGEVKFEEGYKIELKNITYSAGTLKCGLYIDYDYISIKAKIEGKEMKGLVNSPEGEMKLTAKKVK